MGQKALKALGPRYERALWLREEGVSFQKIGIEIGVTAAQARSLEARAKRALSEPDNEFEGLTARARNCLKAEGCKTKEDALQAFREGKLLKIPNLGNKSYREICVWLGIYRPTNEEERLNVGSEDREFAAFKKGFFLGREIESKEGYLSYEDLQEEYRKAMSQSNKLLHL